MGIELEYFVYPERISQELICSICHCVVDKPVQTPSEHLFCEDELIEWMLRSDLCPLTQQILDPNTIKKPGRIISNMLSSLERYCCHKDEGCQWQGTCDRYNKHLLECKIQIQNNLKKELEEKNQLINNLQENLSSIKHIITELETENNQLWQENELLKRKLKVYDAFFEQNTSLLNNNIHNNNNNNNNNNHNNNNDNNDNYSEIKYDKQQTIHQNNQYKINNDQKEIKQTSDVSQLSRLRGLETLSSDSKEKVKYTIKL